MRFLCGLAEGFAVAAVLGVYAWQLERDRQTFAALKMYDFKVRRALGYWDGWDP